MIYLASDHGGFKLKSIICKFLVKNKLAYRDLGPFEFNQEDDYPVFAKLLVGNISNPSDRGILICRSGQGMAIAANRNRKIRAIVTNNSATARAGRKHLDSNVIALPADNLTGEQVRKIIKVWLVTPFETDSRHLRRIKQIS